MLDVEWTATTFLEWIKDTGFSSDSRAARANSLVSHKPVTRLGTKCETGSWLALTRHPENLAVIPAVTFAAKTLSQSLPHHLLLFKILPLALTSSRTTVHTLSIQELWLQNESTLYYFYFQSHNSNWTMWHMATTDCVLGVLRAKVHPVIYILSFRTHNGVSVNRVITWLTHLNDVCGLFLRI